MTLIKNYRLYLFFSLFFLILFSLLSGELNSNWLQHEEEGLIFRYHSRDRRLMEELLPKFIVDITDFHRTIGFYPRIEGEVIIAPNRDYYQKVISGHSGIIEFSEAIYTPAERRIYIRNPRDLKNIARLRRIVLHEYIHLFLDSQFNNVPLWFHEGMAVFFSGDLTFERELRYARDYLLGNSLTLNEMVSRYPDSRIRWESFYAKSALAVKYLYNNNREEFYELWDYNESSVDFSLAFFRSFNLTTRQFSIMLEDHLSRRFRLEILLAFTGIVWGILPVILLLAWLRKKWMNRKIKKNWDSMSSEKGALSLPGSEKHDFIDEDH